MEVRLILIQDLDDKGWQDYYYLDKDRSSAKIESNDWQGFKEDRLEQYKQSPVGFKVEENLLTYNGEAFGWLACILGTEQISFIFDTKYEEIPDDIIKGLLSKVFDQIIRKGKESGIFWSKNSGSSNKLKFFGAEFIEETNDENPMSCFNLSKDFFENYLN